MVAKNIGRILATPGPAPRFLELAILERVRPQSLSAPSLCSDSGKQSASIPTLDRFKIVDVKAKLPKAYDGTSQPRPIERNRSERSDPSRR
jgi:hypothetical protein